MEKPIRSKKQVLFLEIVAIILVFAGFGAMALCEKLQLSGLGDFWFPVGGIGALALFGIIAIVLLFSVRKDAIAYEIEAKEQKLDALPFQSLMGLFPGSVQQRLLAQNFKDVGDGFLRKKVFSALKDSICYYVKCVDSISIKDAFTQTMEEIETRDESGNVCLLLFVSQSKIQKSDLEELRDLSKFYLVTETTIPMPGWKTCLPILVDSSTNEGRFLDTNKKYPISIYTHGCKLLNKIFS